MKNKIRWLIKKLIRHYRKNIQKEKPLPANYANIRRVAYYISGGIGDAIMAFPAVQFLQKILPDAEITVFVPPGKFPVLSVVFEGFRVQPHNSVPGLLLKNGFFRRTFDVAFTNTISVFKVGVELAAFLSSKHLYGFRYQEEKRGNRLYNDSKVFSAPLHATEQNVLLVSKTLHFSYTDNDLFLSAHTYEKKEPGERVVMIHPGSETGYENKRWPIEDFKEIIKRLIQKGYTVTVLLGPSEISMQETFDSGESLQLLIEPDANELSNEFKKTLLFVGNDSGPAHLAAFYGVPQVVLFGPINPERSAPRGINTVSMYNKIDCSPCHFTSSGCENNKCLQSMTVEQVWKEVERMLRKITQL